MSDEIPTVEIDLIIRQECPPLIDNLSLINEVEYTNDALNNSNVK